MFIYIKKIEEASFAADHLQNPVNLGNQMILVFYRSYFSTAIYTGYSKNAAPSYYDRVTDKFIPKRKWSEEMKRYVQECEVQVPKAPFRLKPTIFGYIFILAFIGFFAYLVYDTVKPNPYQQERVSKLSETMNGGDLYFGRFTEKDPSTGAPKGSGFRWFKIMDAGQESLLISKAREHSTTAKTSMEMNSSDFEQETIPMKIKGQESYQIDLVSEDGSLEVTLTEKK